MMMQILQSFLSQRFFTKSTLHTYNQPYVVVEFSVEKNHDTSVLCKKFDPSRNLLEAPQNQLALGRHRLGCFGVFFRLKVERTVVFRLLTYLLARGVFSTEYRFKQGAKLKIRPSTMTSFTLTIQKLLHNVMLWTDALNRAQWQRAQQSPAVTTATLCHHYVEVEGRPSVIDRG